MKGEGGAGGNNLESSFPTLTAKVASTERQTKYSWWTQNVRASRGTTSYIGQALRLTASRCQKCKNEGMPFWTVIYGLVTTDTWKGGGKGTPIRESIKLFIGKLGENTQVARFQRYENMQGRVGTYVHTTRRRRRWCR